MLGAAFSGMLMRRFLFVLAAVLVACTQGSAQPPAASGHVTPTAAIAASNDRSLALLGDGSIWAWGSNCAGKLCRRDAPVQVSGLSNDDGQLGDGTKINRSTPVRVTGF